MSQHKASAKKGKQYLARAIRKHGWESFNVEIMIDEVPEEDLDHLEQSYIEINDSMNPKTGYNLTKGGEGTSGWVPSEEWRKNHSKNMKMHQSKRDQFGTIAFLRKKKVYQVFGPQDGNCKGTYIGQYDSKEEATNALEIFNKTGQKTVSTRTGHMRKMGSGSIGERKGRFRPDFKGTFIGSFVTKEDAEIALQHFIQTRKKLKSRRKGYTLKLKRCGRFKSYYKTKYLGTYSSEQEAEEAIQTHLKQVEASQIK